MDKVLKMGDSYIADKDARKEKVLVGLSGGMDSLVVACLLKIQKFEVHATAIVTQWDDLNQGDANHLSCHVTPARLSYIKEFCQKLGIPFSVTKVNSEFEAEVIERWMSSKIYAQKPRACWDCHKLRLKVLFNKMQELGLSKLATGHFAKIFKNEATQRIYIHTGNDPEADQSILLQELPHEILSHLILPLSDLGKKEVKKLADNFGISDYLKNVEMFNCLTKMEELKPLIEKSLPRHFLKEGDIRNQDRNQSFGDHQGAIFYEVGERVDLKDGAKNLQFVVSDYLFSEKMLIVDEIESLMSQRLYLKNCVFSEELDQMEPLKGFIHLKSGVVECWFQLKNLNSADVELAENVFLCPGEHVKITRKKGRNAKVYLSGEVFVTKNPKPSEDGESHVNVPNPALDF